MFDREIINYEVKLSLFEKVYLFRRLLTFCFLSFVTQVLKGHQHFFSSRCRAIHSRKQRPGLCSGYLRKETAVVSIVLPFVYRGYTHFAVHLKNSHRKKEEILRWIANKKSRNSQMDSEVTEPIVNERQNNWNHSCFFLQIARAL